MNTIAANIHPDKARLSILACLISAFFVSGCGGGGSATTSPGAIPDLPPSPQLITGQALKGPMHDSVVEILGPAGHVLATGQVQNGNFELSAAIAAHPYIEIRARGGYFTDEATGLRVDVPSNQGLHAMLAASDFQTRAGQVMLTPETTVVTGMVRQSMQAGSDLATSMNQAREIFEQQFIGDSRPPGIAADMDVMAHFGMPLTPATMQDALAWQRARTFSHYAREMGLAPESIFQLMDALALDMHDSLLDGRAAGDPISFPHATGGVFDMTTQDHGLRFSQARAGLLHSDLSMVFNGEASTDFRHHLELTSLDLAPFDMLHDQHSQGISTTAENLLAENLPEFQHLPVLSDEDGDSQNAEGHYTLRAVSNVDVTIQAPGTSWVTPMYRYNGMQLPPIISAKRGDEMFLTLVNELADMTTIHWHGSKVPAAEDGGPTEPVSPNAARMYHFTLNQPSGSLWFHPHPHGQTAEQVYRGLAGVLLLSDDVDDELRQGSMVPAIQHDIPILVQDRLFDAETSGVRQLSYSADHMSGFGMMGGVILVNGVELPRLNVETRQYTLRLYNASNSRTYDFAFSDGRMFNIVGSDGGWLPQPIQANNIVLSAGERAAIVVNFAADQPGNRVMLVSQPFMGGAATGMTQFQSTEQQGGMGGGHHSGGHGSEPKVPGEGADIMRFDVTVDAVDTVQLYERLPEAAEIWSRLEEQAATVERSFIMSWSHEPGQFLINGKQYSEDRVDEQVEPGATEIWEITNISPVPHPFHPHAIQWQVLDRNGSQPTGVEQGWKDTVLVKPGERVRIIGRFEPVNVGKYVYHCHILEHEDAGMMGLFEVMP
ncbi:MAG: multicopper oxidase domain-containing protein [Gammaproteobacteria bacterium]|nr:multicopper oxidase domain-containing protein [Gammaproteobacteria bacterium]